MIWRHLHDKWERSHFGTFHHAFIVGQGPSLAKIDASKLAGPGRVVIGMNNTYPTLRPDFWLGMDDTNCWEQQLFAEPFPKILAEHSKCDSFHGRLLRDVPGVHFAGLRTGGGLWRFLEDGYFSWERDTFRVAIQFALSLGVGSISFVGVDLDNSRADYHDGSYLSDKQRETNRWLYDKQFKMLRDELVPKAVARGIVVTSCSPESRINSIMPFVPANVMTQAIERALPSGRPKKHNSDKLDGERKGLPIPIPRAIPQRQVGILLNDCSNYHVGSRAVTRSLHRLAGEVELGLVPHESGMNCKPGQLVIVNGEGTMHHNAKRALDIHCEAARLKAQGARVVLLNTVLQGMDVDLSVYSQIVTRESLSAEFARTACPGVPVTVIPDLALCHPAKAGRPTKRNGIVFIDSVDEVMTGEIESLAKDYGVAGEMLRLCECPASIDELISHLRGFEAVVTGRFHGAVLAMLAGTPFCALPSNTWKTKGLLKDFGMAEHYHENMHTVRAALESRTFALPDAQRVERVGDQWREFFRALVAPTLA